MSSASVALLTVPKSFNSVTVTESVPPLKRNEINKSFVLKHFQDLLENVPLMCDADWELESSHSQRSQVVSHDVLQRLLEREEQLLDASASDAAEDETDAVAVASDQDLQGEMSDYDNAVDVSLDDSVSSEVYPDIVRPLLLDFYDDDEINRFAKRFLKKYSKGNMNRTGAVDMWDLFREFSKFPREELMSYDTFERRVKNVIPTPELTWRVRNIETQEDVTGRGKCFPEKLYGNKNVFETREMWTRLSLKDVIRMHAGMHLDHCDFVEDGVIDFSKVHVTFTADGIPHGNSSNENLHVLAVRFKGCRQVYILQARVAKRKEPKILDDFLLPFVRECNSLNVTVDFFLADSPMRAFFKSLKGHAGRSSCEICEATGRCVDGRICYPADQILGRKRSHERWLEQVADLESQREEGPTGDVAGVTGRSPLLEINNFDMVRKAPPDPLHRDWLGIAKSTLWRNTTGMSKAGVMNSRGNRIANAVSNDYRRVRLPSEFSHRSRPVDYPNFKGHEWKSLVVTSFTAIADIVKSELGHQLAHVWTLFAWMILLYNGPAWAFNEMDDEYLEELHQQLYDEFQMEFGSRACTFNWHSFYHMPTVRKIGPSSQLSTEPFESSYGKVQKSFAAGTRSTGLQIVRNMLLRTLAHTSEFCENRIKMENSTECKRSDDSIVVDSVFTFYKVRDVRGDHVDVSEMEKEKWHSPHDITLPFDKVGVFKFKGTSDAVVTMPRKCFVGKGVLRDDGILIALHEDLLFS